MSFQEDLTTVLKAEIGPSASLFYKKCMLKLGKDPRCITPDDLEEIADWAYEEIRTMIDDKTAFRVRHRIVQIPPNAKEMKRPFHSLPPEKQKESHPSAESEEVPGLRSPFTYPVAPEPLTDTVPEPATPSQISDLFSNLKEKQHTSPDQVHLPNSQPVHSGERSLIFDPVPGTPGPLPAQEIPGNDNQIFARPPDELPAVAMEEPPVEHGEETEVAPEDSGPDDAGGSKPATIPDMIHRFLSELEADEDNPPLWEGIADLYMRSGKFKEATEAWQRVIELGVENPAIWSSLGDSCKKLGQYEDSDQAYTRSLELNPEDPEVWLKRAKVLVSRNRYDDAIAACDQSLTLDESAGATWHYKAFVLRKTRRNEEALEIYVYLSSIDKSDENAARQVAAIRKILDT